MAGFLTGAGAGRRAGRGAESAPLAAAGTGSPAVPGLPQPAASGREVPLGPPGWAAALGPPQTGRAPVWLGSAAFGVFRGSLHEFNFDLPSCHVPQAPYLFRAVIYSSLTKNSRGTTSLLKDSISFTEVSASGLFEGHDLLRRGFTSVKNELLPSHPLELTEKNFQLNQDKTNFATLRNIQGIHAPLKLQMEFRAVKQVQRLPFLHSSNIAMDILRGNDECIGFEDILNDPSQSEVMGEPHMMMEHKLGLL
ncbi:PREDICTED: proteasome maturation protein [Ficedula albicollis]|uniref:Proteasome maturation protein n=1 Tax=Ficedula albicollis TaxID=59894 RepID=U3K1K2_FICAL|nr:PREDICTED: proteasome maturation protein [Ficedula albicollis]